MLVNFQAFWAKKPSVLSFFPRQTTQLFMTSVFKSPAGCIAI